MPRLLFCWELGANLGHVATIAAISPQFTALGYDVSYAVADLRAARSVLGNDAQLFQAPVWPYHRHSGARVQAASFADTLTLIGFGLADHLDAVACGWLNLFAMVSPDILVVDHGPAAQVAALIAHKRVITIGTGFTQPPLEANFLPPLRADLPAAQPESSLLAAAHEVLSAHSFRNLPTSMTRLLSVDARIIVGLPELDPYRSFRRESFVAPVGGFVAPVGRGTKRLFVYLGPEMPDLEGKIRVLCDLPIPVEIYVRDGGSLLNEFIRIRGKIPHDRPASTSEVLARSSHVLSQGGAMLSSEALAAGCPHLILPLHREPEINSALLVQAGGGRSADPRADVVEFGRAVQSFLADIELEERTKGVARLLTHRRLEPVDSALLRALAAGSPSAVTVERSETSPP